MICYIFVTWKWLASFFSKCFKGILDDALLWKSPILTLNKNTKKMYDGKIVFFHSSVCLFVSINIVFVENHK